MTTVFISGTWEILHIGHVRVLEKAATLGDRLIVGVVTDEFAASYKRRSIIPYEERVEIVAALRVVDKVVPHRFFEDYEAMIKHGVTIRTIGPEHGDHEEQRRALKWCKKAGIEVVALPRTPGVSTTLIREKIREETTCTCSPDDPGAGVYARDED